MIDDQEAVRQSRELTNKIGPLLGGRNKTIVYLTLVDLVAAYLASYPPQERAQMQQWWTDCDQMAEVIANPGSVGDDFGDEGGPPDAPGQSQASLSPQ